VVLVGHCYGGAIITLAGVEDNVKALVYLSGYALEEGESLAELQGRFADPPLAAALVYSTFPIDCSTKTGTDVSVDIEQFPSIFAADIDEEFARVLAASQRPLAAAAFSEAASAAAWKTKPSWGSVSTEDRTTNPDVERFGYKRAGTAMIEIDSPDLVMLSHPKEVADLIRQATDGASN
jgi:pimeloyl-ACP methyl ester carboxylesterase